MPGQACEDLIGKALQIFTSRTLDSIAQNSKVITTKHFGVKTLRHQYILELVRTLWTYGLMRLRQIGTVHTHDGLSLLGP